MEPLKQYILHLGPPFLSCVSAAEAQLQEAWARLGALGGIEQNGFDGANAPFQFIFAHIWFSSVPRLRPA